MKIFTDFIKNSRSDQSDSHAPSFLSTTTKPSTTPANPAPTKPESPNTNRTSFEEFFEFIEYERRRSISDLNLKD